VAKHCALTHVPRSVLKDREMLARPEASGINSGVMGLVKRNGDTLLQVKGRTSQASAAAAAAEALGTEAFHMFLKQFPCA